MLIIKEIRKSYMYFRITNFIKEFYYKYILDDKTAIIKQFKKRVGRMPNLENPEYFTDKIQWLKLNWYDDSAIIAADKYKVRELIEDKIGLKYLNTLYGVYDSVDEINIEDLPQAFVLKGTHGSGYNLICR